MRLKLFAAGAIVALVLLATASTVEAGRTDSCAGSSADTALVTPHEWAGTEGER